MAFPQAEHVVEDRVADAEEVLGGGFGLDEEDSEFAE